MASSLTWKKNYEDIDSFLMPWNTKGFVGKEPSGEIRNGQITLMIPNCRCSHDDRTPIIMPLMLLSI